MEKQHIIILDFLAGEVYISDYDPNIVDSGEEYFDILNKEYNLNLGETNCQWMVVPAPFDIKIL